MKRFVLSLLCHRSKEEVEVEDKTEIYSPTLVYRVAEDPPSTPSTNSSSTFTSLLNRVPSLKNRSIDKTKKYLPEAKERFLIEYDKASDNNGKCDDFEQIRTLGTGSFGRVLLVQHLQNQNYFAMKILSKEKIVKLDQIEHTLNEKHLLQSLSFPFLVNLKYHFKDNSYLYLVLEFVPGGELFNLLRKCNQFNEEQAQFYASQIVLAFEYLHYLDIIYRDLKPENILITSDGYLKLTDFGFAKISKDRTYSLCGTPEYMAPEMIFPKGYNKAVDWWALGVLIYEMLAGYSPFYDEDQMQLCQNIISGHFEYPTDFNNNLKDLLSHLLDTDVTKRFGNLKNGADDIKKHRWFYYIDWMKILERKVKPPYLPISNGPGDTSQFDQYEEEQLQIESEDRYKKQFQHF